jgi:hypothetical protein
MKTQINMQLFCWLGIVLLIFIFGSIDWQTGYELNFFAFYFIPIAIAAWFIGIKSAVVFSVVSTCVWVLADNLSGHNYSSTYYVVWNTLIRLISFLVIGWSTHKINVLFQSEKRKTERLQKALSEIKTLESFLSICCVCKKIRNEDGNWQQMESYISGHSETRFSHGFCPECAKKAMEETGLIK